jgi:type III restriction enzyme
MGSTETIRSEAFASSARQGAATETRLSGGNQRDVVRSEVPGKKKGATIKALLNAYNPVGSTRHVRFRTSKTNRWDTSGPPPKSHVNWIILESDWDGEFCRVAEQHPLVKAYVKNQGLDFSVPYRHLSDAYRYFPDFILLVDDGAGDANDILHLVVEIKGYRGKNTKDQKTAMETCWIPGINDLKTFGRWAFAEFTQIWTMPDDFATEVEKHFCAMMRDDRQEDCGW